MTGGVLVDRLEPQVHALVASVSNGRQIQAMNPLATGWIDLKLISRFAGTNAGELIVLNGVNFSWCPAGRFRMGCLASEKDRNDDETQVLVELSQGF